MKAGKLILELSVIAFLTITGYSQGPGFGPRYDPATETILHGTVEQVIETPGRRSGPGIHLRFKTESDTLDVRVGPVRFLHNQEFTLAEGDQLEITASKVFIDGTPAYIARMIKKGDQTIILRDADGRPRWTTRGRG